MCFKIGGGGGGVMQWMDDQTLNKKMGNCGRIGYPVGSSGYYLTRQLRGEGGW